MGKFCLGVTFVLVQFLSLGQLTEDEKMEWRTFLNQSLKNHCEVNAFHDYPDMPEFPDSLLPALQLELKDDSARYHLQSLTCKNWPDHHRYKKAIRYFKRERKIYCLLATSSHWTPDRVYAIQALYDLCTMRLLINQTLEAEKKMRAQEAVIAAFFVSVLGQIPWAISGSENSTIHGGQVRQMARTIDFVLYGKVSSEPLWKDDINHSEKKLEQWKKTMNHE